MKKTFQVAITKSFLINVDAENEKLALELAEFFTSGIEDLSSENDKKKHNFTITEIEHTYTQTQIISDNE